MRAALYRDMGKAAEVFRVEDIPRPEPGPGEVLVRVHASGVNPTDYKARSGAVPRPIDGFQIPHHDGAGIIDTVGPGVDPGDLVVNYRSPDAADQVRAFGAVDRIIEVALGANLELDLAVIRPHGTIVTYAAEPANPELPVRACMTANLTLRFVLLYGVPMDALERAAADITAALAAGELTGLPVHKFPLEDIAAAHEAAEGGAVGKVIVTP